MKKPVIGIVGNISCKAAPGKFQVNATYVNAVRDAGGTPLILPAVGNDPALAEEYIDMLDGILFAGGEDISSYLFGEDPCRFVDYISSERDCLEFALVKLADERHMPMIGICRGHQVLNVVFGGNLYQDLPSQKPEGLMCHKQDMAIRSELTHSVNVVPGSFCEMFGPEPLFVNTYHHQAVKDVAPDFTVSAVAPDGVIEAIESEKHNCKSVQWHPEELYKRWPRFKPFFESFIADAAKYAANK